MNVKGSRQMRITIETTVSEPKYSYKVATEVGYDDIDIANMQELLVGTLAGCGYAFASIESIFAGYKSISEVEQRGGGAGCEKTPQIIPHNEF